MRVMGLTGPHPMWYFFSPYSPTRELDFLHPTDDPGPDPPPHGC
jgi:hypothetical protein